MFADVHPLGFFAGARAHDVEDLIGQTEQLVISLGPTEADLTPAREALTAAKALYAAERYSKALAQARRAAALAMSLNERFNAYLAAWKGLQGCREELEQLGFPTAPLDTALDQADKEVVHQIAEGDAMVPNYLGATEILDCAVEESKALLTRARAASREVFLATLAVEALSDSSSNQEPSWLAVRLEERLEQATRELALGHIPEAVRIATEVRARADTTLEGAARAWDLLDLAAAILDGLAAAGEFANGLKEQIEAARASLSHGFLDRTTALVVAQRLSDAAALFAKHYAPASSILEQAEGVYASLRENGLSSPAAEAYLQEARRALMAGTWDGVRASVEAASREYISLRTQQQVLDRAVAEIDARVRILRDCRLPLLPQVQELLGRAREEIRSGQLSGAHVDVNLARAMMFEATRTGS